MGNTELLWQNTRSFYRMFLTKSIEKARTRAAHRDPKSVVVEEKCIAVYAIDLDCAATFHHLPSKGYWYQFVEQRRAFAATVCSLQYSVA